MFGPVVTSLLLAVLGGGPQDALRGPEAELIVPKIDHAPLTCVVKDDFAEITATIEPANRVHARLYFTSGRDLDFYFVEMRAVDGRFVGILPRPKEGAGPITYYITAATTEGAVKRSPLATAEVNPMPGGCGQAPDAATLGKIQDVDVYSTGSLNAPQGFSGVATVRRAVTETGAARGSTPPSSTPTDPAAATSTSQVAKGGTPEYTLGKGDLIRVIVYGHEDLTQALAVQEDGAFSFPLIGYVQAQGLTPKELERRLADALSHGFVRNPQISVTVQEYHSKSVFVVGEVARPGPYPLSGSMTVMEVLAKAGPTDGGGADIVIVRPTGDVNGPVLPEDAASAEVIRVNLREIRMGKLDKNIVVHANDTVFVSAAAKVFVTGEVRSPGGFPYQPGLTVRQAISMAGGLSPDGSFARIQVVRDAGGAKPKEAKIRVDDPIQAGDTIVVKAKLF